MISLFQVTIDIAGNVGRGPAPLQTDLGKIISSFIGAGILIGALLAMMYMVWGGVQWVSSGGDKGKIDKAREKITQSVVGLAILTALFAFFQVVEYFFGFNILAG